MGARNKVRNNAIPLRYYAASHLKSVRRRFKVAEFALLAIPIVRYVRNVR